MADARHRPTPLGASGLKVSKLWLGAMMFGDQTGEAEAGRIVAAAREAGVNAIDTADAYAGGESERITGRLIAADRERWVLATKLFNPTSSDPNDRGLSRRHMIRALDASLKRLGTDWVDILYLHRDDATTPLEEIVAAMGHLLSTGKVHYFGVSNFRAWRVARIAEMLPRRERSGADRLPAAVQRHDAGRSRPSCCRAARTTASASSPTARSRAAS